MTTLFSDRLIAWFDTCGRHDLPWQSNPSPYRVWISEIMLQQTKVSTVIPYFKRFIKKFPNVLSLKNANIDEVLTLWAGLGYYTRGRNLHRAAKIICDDFNGILPADRGALLTLPGIGRSTAGAIMALAFQQPHAILDANVKRVLCRFYAINGCLGESVVEQQLWKLAEALTPKQQTAEYTQAMMDLGATICTHSGAKCDICPVSCDCLSRKKGLQYQYPRIKPKKTIPLRKIIFLLLENKAGKILLQRRATTGIWGGLWCFPECDPKDDIEKYLLDTTGFNGSVIRKLAVVKHTLTHFRMEILPVHLKMKAYDNVGLKEDQRWYFTADALEFGVPTPVKKILQSITE